ncbi:hypothetical protein BpHYR1_014999 [Brachionus plicatilis]|uniref:MULE transposase domain-containing protein n=1 Tax=Brachionus plicatilis TaxID=10195 RepID=A0A3M7RHF4_BRAPC|nr:hypothetical protein BpHYR1_014999 [Brachionus plicatilis]
MTGDDKRYYDCYTMGKKVKCPFKMYLFLHPDTQYCTVFMSDDKHSHEKQEDEIDCEHLSKTVRNEIIRIFENETHQATSIQIYNLIQRYKKSNYGPANMTLNQLIDYCNAHINLPDNLDEVFIPKTYFEASITEAKEFDFCPNKLVADAAPAITNGFTKVFNHPFSRVICWAHVIRNIDSNLITINDEPMRKSIRNQIIRSISNNKIGKKNNESVKVFSKYFNDVWLSDSNDAWYESYSLRTPSTNNALESTNRIIKDEATFRKRLSVSDFLNMVSTKLLKRWSKERSVNYTDPIHFKFAADINLRTWTKAWHWQCEHCDINIPKKTDHLGST